jgi:hypothetical protein
VFFSIAGIAGLVSVNSIYAWWIDRRRIPRVVKALEHGSVDLKALEDDPYYPRPKEEAILAPLLSPSHGGSFNLITGEHGTGTFVRLSSLFIFPLFSFLREDYCCACHVS